MRAKRKPGGLSKRRENLLMGYLFISPWLLGFIGLTLVPILSIFYLGFTSYDIFSAPVFVGLRNFRKMFTDDPRYVQSVVATLYFALVSVPLKLVFALAVAMLLNTRHRFLGVYRAWFYTPSILGTSVAVAVMWREVFGSSGLVNALLAALGHDARIAWLGDPTFAIWTLILLVVWQFGSPMLIFLSGLKQIPKELYECSQIDGASRWRRFVRITLPMLSPVVFFNLIMQMIFQLTVFTQPFIITQGGPMGTTNFYALYLYRRAFESFQMGYGAAMALILVLTVAAFTGIIFKTGTLWVHYETKEGR
jgi:multiple sugar transport system permease protein